MIKMNPKKKDPNALTFKEKISYGVGSSGDALIYSLIGSFAMFFLTTVAGLDPGAAGIITAVGAVWNALFNPIMGYIADGFGSKYGRRRPLMMGFAVPLMISAFLLFTNVDLPHFAKTVYYGVMVMLYWTTYTGVFLPYLALGTDYSSDYDQRTILRLYASVFNNIGSVIAMSCTNVLVDFLVKRGFTTSSAWSFTGGVMGVITLLSFFITFATSKEKDPPCEPDRSRKGGFDLVSLIKEYFAILKLKPMKYLVAASIASLICYSMIIACGMYFFTFNMGFSAGKTSLLLSARVLVAFAIIPVSGKLAIKFDKHRALMILAAAGAAILIITRFTGVGNGFLLAFFILGVSLCANSYWQLMPGIFYDVCEYDTYVTGKKRQATVLSFQGLIESTATGLGSLILGTVLKLAGFVGTADVQSGTALTWIYNCTTLIPAAFFILAIIALAHYPLTRAKYEEIRKELVRRHLAEQDAKEAVRRES